MPSRAWNQFNALHSGRGSVPKEMRYTHWQQNVLLDNFVTRMPEYVQEQGETTYTRPVRNALLSLYKSFHTYLMNIRAKDLTVRKQFFAQNVRWIDDMFGLMDKGYQYKERGEERDSVEVVVWEKEQVLLEELQWVLADFAMVFEGTAGSVADIIDQIDGIVERHQLSSDHPCLLGLKTALESDTPEERFEGFKLYMQYIFETLYQNVITKNEKVVVHKEPFTPDGWSLYTVRPLDMPDEIHDAFVRRKGIYVDAKGFTYKYIVAYECDYLTRTAVWNALLDVEVYNQAWKQVDHWETDGPWFTFERRAEIEDGVKRYIGE